MPDNPNLHRSRSLDAVLREIYPREALTTLPDGRVFTDEQLGNEIAREQKVMLGSTTDPNRQGDGGRRLTPATRDGGTIWDRLTKSEYVFEAWDDEPAPPPPKASQDVGTVFWALEQMRQGNVLTRQAWHDGQTLRMRHQVGEDQLIVKNAIGTHVGVGLTTDDIEASDWALVS